MLFISCDYYCVSSAFGYFFHSKRRAGCRHTVNKPKYRHVRTRGARGSGQDSLGVLAPGLRERCVPLRSAARTPPFVPRTLRALPRLTLWLARPPEQTPDRPMEFHRPISTVHQYCCVAAPLREKIR